MRGVAAITAALALWLIAGHRVVRLRLPPRPAIDRRLLLEAFASAASATLLTLGLTAAPAIAAGVGALGAAAPFWWSATRTRRQRAQTVDRWPDLLAALRSHLAAGVPLLDAFLAAARDAGGALAEGAAQVEEALIRGDDFSRALDELRAHLADPMADRVLVTLAEATHTGGRRVGDIVAALGASVADDLRLRKAHDAALTQQRLTAAVALFAPWALLVLTVSTNPQALEAYRTASGSLVVATGLAATGLGYLLARRTARLSRPPRLLE